MAKLRITYRELAELIRINPDLPETIRGVQAEEGAIMLNVRPLRIAPPMQVRMYMERFEDGRLHCPFETEGHLSWLLRHLVPSFALNHVQIEEDRYVINLAALLSSRIPNVRIDGIFSEDGTIVVEFTVVATNNGV